MAQLLYEIWVNTDGTRRSLCAVSPVDDELRARLDRGYRLAHRFWAASRFAALREEHRRFGQGPFRPRPGERDQVHDEATAAAQRAYLAIRPSCRRMLAPAAGGVVRRAPPCRELPMPPRAQAGLWRYRFRARRRALRHACRMRTAA
ncbi:hypothetical protein U1839_01465 [Sphingomonas sp. RT2P30]|uniref:hypothetical protein n=1 Tax=Parasphingomonas halimpatiens TaxID=3096162 RepID=UPI002FCB4DF8